MRLLHPLLSLLFRFLYADPSIPPKDGQVPLFDDDEDEMASMPDKEFLYNIEHDVAKKWTPRGQMRVHFQKGGYSVRLIDADDFKPSTLLEELKVPASKNAFYKLRLSPSGVAEGSKDHFCLHASVPAQLVSSAEDMHDMFELTLSPSGIPVGFNYRVLETFGLHLFEHTAVHISEPHYAIEPHVTPRKQEEKQKEEQAQQGSFLSRYWWVILIGLVLVMSGGAGEEKAGGGGGGGR